MTAPLFIDLFDAVAQARGSHPAVVTDGTHSVSYADLRAQALNIAAHLPAGDDGRLIAISIDKSADYLAAVLACWYARASFLPLDPALPPERRALILAEAKPLCILAAQPLEASVAVIDITALPLRDFTPRAPSPADAAAYVIYTSGSTGAPKGVIVSHRGLVAVLQQQIALFDLDANSRSLFYLSTAFDASISDFGTALLAGATLYIESAGKLDTAAHLARILAARAITYADLPPALLRLLDPAQMPASLRSICIGGEVCPPAVVRRWAQDRRIVCVYGPTEATICTSASICDPLTWQAPLIGAPLDGVSYAILDPARTPCDDGELYIAGPHLANGYLAQDSLTAQKFVMIDGQRWYRTGDHVRRTGDGIEFIGRIDRQFKWRGQLVEPEEIEQALCRLDGISRAALLRDTTNGHERLVAHIESTHEQDMAQIQARLAKTLPAWMIPTHIVTHTQLPLTATGKINRSALAARASHAAPSRGTPFTPATATEQRLLACWQRVLRQERIPADTPFSALGGDSFAVLQLLLEAEKADLRLTPDFVARHTTLGAQARHLHSDDTHSPMQDAALLRAHVLSQFPIPAAARDGVQSGDMLLTGATGFLGRQILLRLLEHTDATIHVILRAASTEQGWQRLGLDARFKPRLRILCGDMTQEHFGLDAQDWAQLASRITTIIHCAAVVNMALPYAALEDANVRAVHTLICLAATGCAKHIHHASTLSVFVATDRNSGTARESDTLDATRQIYGGYAQSKWAAEILLQAARTQGHTVTLHRLGLITGDSATGEYSCHDFLRTFMQGVISLGHIPAGNNDSLLVDATPVDYAADMMVAAVSAYQHGCLHIANTRGFSWPQIMQGLHRNGHALTALEPQAWDDWLAARRAAQPLNIDESAAVMAMCRALGTQAFERHRTMDLFQGTDIVFDSAHLRAVHGWRAPPLADDALLDLYIRTFTLRPMPAKNAAIA